VCLACGHRRPSYNSCHNRHCPKCPAVAQAKWIAGRLERVLPTHYFHVVFTLPAELRTVARSNPVLAYDLLFRCAAQTLLELGRDPKRLGGELGVTTVLHTWARDLSYHPHVHCVVTGGGSARMVSVGSPLVTTTCFPSRCWASCFVARCSLPCAVHEHVAR
jgi:hypothetical protein